MLKDNQCLTTCEMNKNICVNSVSNYMACLTDSEKSIYTQYNNCTKLDSTFIPNCEI